MLALWSPAHHVMPTTAAFDKPSMRRRRIPAHDGRRPRQPAADWRRRWRAAVPIAAGRHRSQRRVGQLRVAHRAGDALAVALEHPRKEWPGSGRAAAPAREPWRLAVAALPEQRLLRVAHRGRRSPRLRRGPARIPQRRPRPFRRTRDRVGMVGEPASSSSIPGPPATPWIAALRDRFRSTQMHNTLVTIDGRDHAVAAAGPFHWQAPAPMRAA